MPGARTEAGVVRLNPSIPAEGVVAITGLFGQLAVALENSEDHDPNVQDVPGLDLVAGKSS